MLLLLIKSWVFSGPSDSPGLSFGLEFAAKVSELSGLAGAAAVVLWSFSEEIDDELFVE